MTVKELIGILFTIPADAEVYRVGGEYSGDERRIGHVEYRAKVRFGAPSNSVLID